MVGRLLPSNRTLIDALPGLGNATTTPVRVLIFGAPGPAQFGQTDSIAHFKLDRHRSSPLALALQAGGSCIQPQPRPRTRGCPASPAGLFLCASVKERLRQSAIASAATSHVEAVRSIARGREVHQVRNF